VKLVGGKYFKFRLNPEDRSFRGILFLALIYFIAFIIVWANMISPLSLLFHDFLDSFLRQSFNGYFYENPGKLLLVEYVAYNLWFIALPAFFIFLLSLRWLRKKWVVGESLVHMVLFFLLFWAVCLILFVGVR